MFTSVNFSRTHSTSTFLKSTVNLYDPLHNQVVQLFDPVGEHTADTGMFEGVSHLLCKVDGSWEVSLSLPLPYDFAHSANQFSEIDGWHLLEDDGDLL